MFELRNMILPTLCGSLLANSIYFNGKLGSVVGSLNAVLLSHTFGLIFVILVYLLAKGSTNLFVVRKFKLSSRLAFEILGVIIFSFLLVYSANKAVNFLQAFLAIPMFLISVVLTTCLFELFFYKKMIPIYALVTLGIGGTVVMYYFAQLNLEGVFWSFLAAIGVYLSRNLQRKISTELTPFTCTLIIYSTLGVGGIVIFFGNSEVITQIISAQPSLLAGGIIGAAFQFILAITLVRHGNLKTNTFIQISQIIFGLITRWY